MKKTTILILVLIGFNLNAQSFDNEKFDKEKMDKLFSSIENNQKGMGSVSLFQDGKQVYQNSIGFASIKDNVKATDKTKYRIGSISKTFTSSIIMLLIEEGKLTLDTKLSDYFPQVKNAEKISIEHLLRHRSGIFNITSSDDFSTWMLNPISKKELVNKIVSLGKVFEPDEKMQYSNSNYILLSFIAEKIDKKELSEIIQTRINKPCNLNNTYYGSKISVANNEALSYVKADNWELEVESDMSFPQGAGAIVSNPTDLNAFLNCLYTHKIVSKDSLDAMTELKDSYGLGMFQVPFHEKRAFGHNGRIDGFQANAFYFPKEKLSVAYTSNGTVMSVNDIMIAVLSIYYGTEYKLPTFKPTIELSSEQLDQFLGVYASPDLPMKIIITKNENALVAQATGQSSFELDAYENNVFQFDPAGIKLLFKPAENTMTLKQGGGEFVLTKE